MTDSRIKGKSLPFAILGKGVAPYKALQSNLAVTPSRPISRSSRAASIGSLIKWLEIRSHAKVE